MDREPRRESRNFSLKQRLVLASGGVLTAAALAACGGASNSEVDTSPTLDPSPISATTVEAPTATPISAIEKPKDLTPAESAVFDYGMKVVRPEWKKVILGQVKGLSAEYNKKPANNGTRFEYTMNISNNAGKIQYVSSSGEVQIEHGEYITMNAFGKKDNSFETIYSTLNTYFEMQDSKDATEGWSKSESKTTDGSDYISYQKVISKADDGSVDIRVGYAVANANGTYTIGGGACRKTVDDLAYNKQDPFKTLC